MTKTCFAGVALAGSLTFAIVSPVSAKELKVISDQSVTGFGHVESVGCDPKGKALYASDFGPDLKPGDKDGKGYVSKLSLDGKIVDKNFLPAAGTTMNKPKGNWIIGNRLWAADIDGVWIFDLKTKQGKKLDLPGFTFANDLAVAGNTLYVGDSRADKIVSVTPADFLNAKSPPKITEIYSGKGIFPNGIYPAKAGSLIIVGFKSKDEPRGIYTMKSGQEPKPISQPIGVLDGLYQMSSGDLLVTDWATGSLFQWNEKMGIKILAKDFKGPADFCIIPNNKGLTAYVPDLVQGNIRIIQLGN
jgi:hypothetical protein